MADDQLVFFIQAQRKRGMNDTDIKAMLVGSNWPNEVIDQALFMIPRPAPPIPNPEEPAATMYTEDPHITDETDIETKPKRIHYISILFFIMAVLFGGSAITLVGVFSVLESSLGSLGVPFNFFKSFPSIAFIPALFSLLSFFIFYVAFKVRDGSRFSFWLAVSSLIGIPIISVMVTVLFMAPFFNSLATAPTDIATPSLSKGLQIDASTLFLYIPTLILIVASYNIFHFAQKALSKKVRIILIMLFVIGVIPVAGFITYRMIQPEEIDFGYQSAQGAVPYHIYKPAIPIYNLTNATRFETGRELGGQTNAVSVGYDIPVKYILQGEKPRILAMRQVEVTNIFDLQLFIKNNIQDPKTIQTAPLPNAKYQTAITVEKRLENSTFNYVAYITPDNVLIYIVGPAYSTNQLLEFAKTLK